MQPHLAAIGAVAFAALSACAQPRASATTPRHAAGGLTTTTSRSSSRSTTQWLRGGPSLSRVVARDGDIVWDIVDDFTVGRGRVLIVSADPGAVEEVATNPEPRKKKGKFRGRERGKRYKYTVRLGAYVHDPEFEPWP